MLKGPNVDPIDREVETCEFDDVVNREFLLEEVWCDSRVGQVHGEEEFEP